MWRERIKAYEQKQNDIYSNRQKEIKALNLKYQDIYKEYVKIVIYLLIGAVIITCLTIITIIYFMDEIEIYGDIAIMAMFLYLSLMIGLFGYHRSKYPQYYDEIRKIINGPAIKPIHVYMMAISMLFFGMFFLFF